MADSIVVQANNTGDVTELEQVRANFLPEDLTVTAVPDGLDGEHVVTFRGSPDVLEEVIHLLDEDGWDYDLHYTPLTFES